MIRFEPLLKIFILIHLMGTYSFSEEKMLFNNNIDRENLHLMKLEQQLNVSDRSCIPWPSLKREYVTTDDLTFIKDFVFGMDFYHPTISKYRDSLSETIGMNFFVNYKLSENIHRSLYFSSMFSFDRLVLKENGFSTVGVPDTEFMIFKFLIGIEDEQKLSTHFALGLLFKTGIGGSGIVGYKKLNPDYDYSQLDMAISRLERINKKNFFPLAADVKLKVLPSEKFSFSFYFGYVHIFYSREHFSIYNVGVGAELRF